MPGLYFVTGTIKMPGPLPVQFSRNMTVVRRGDRLVLVNSVRLDDAGIATLATLDKVTDVVRLAANRQGLRPGSTRDGSHFPCQQSPTRAAQSSKRNDVVTWRLAQ